MARSHFQHKKRQKELKRKTKKDQKRQRKLDKKIMESEEGQNHFSDEKENDSEKT
ncbi:MAG: hypothetical protein R6U50_02050 [Desulfobacterales bacterium]